MAWSIQKLIDTDTHPRLNALRNGINSALDGVKVVQQVGCLAVKVKARFGQLNAARVTHKQHHVQPGLHAFNGVTDGRGGHAQLGGGFAETAKTCRSGEGKQVLFGKDGIHITALVAISFEHILTALLHHI